jgi:imidazolonepropionase
MAANEKGLKQMADAGTVAVLLPGTSFFLGSTAFAPAKKMIELGCKVAIATDFNPGSSMSEFLPIMCTMACTYMKMTPGEVLKAVTVNAAQALSRDDLGIIAPGKIADIVLMDIPSIDYFPYHYGVNHVESVFKKGECVDTRNI